jgi:hypothetical protein
VDQECIHLLDVTLKPAIGVVALAVFAEDFRVAVDDPGVHTHNNLRVLISASSITESVGGGGVLLPQGNIVQQLSFLL